MNKKKKTAKNKSKTTYKVKKTFEIFRVDWKDHVTGNHSWRIDADISTDIPICTTVGMKVLENDDIIVLAQNTSSLLHLSDTTSIIKSCVVFTEKLGEVKYIEEA